MANRDYLFMEIAEAMKSIIYRRVNLIGVVVQTSFPKKSQGTDCCVCIKIVDETSPNNSLPVNVFMKEMDDLPRVALVGDIIQFYQVTMQPFDNTFIAVYNKKYSAFALYDGKCYVGYIPYQKSCNFDQLSKGDKGHNFVSILRSLVAYNPKELKGLEHLKSLKEIESGEIDLVCKILHICERREGEWIIYIWDGTDTPSIPIEAKLEDDDSTGSSLPLDLEPFSLLRAVFSKFPVVGSILKVKVNEDYGKGKLDLKYLIPGKWVKLHRLNCDNRVGLWNIELSQFSKFCYLDDEEEVVLSRESDYQKRAKTAFLSRPLQCLDIPTLTVTDAPEVPFSPLMYILSHREVTAKFRCVVRIISAWPWRVEDFRSPKGGICRVRFTLEDPTARIHAILYAEDGIQFFGDLDRIEDVRKKRNMLLDTYEDENGVEKDAPRNPPWIQCCIKSYYLDKNNRRATRKFRIFATKFVG